MNWAKLRANERRFDALATLASICVFSLLSIAVAFAKRPWSDEGWFADPAFNLVRYGFMGTTVLFNPHLPHIDQHTYWVLPLYLVSLAGWFKIIGFGLMQMRSLSIIFGIVAIWSWHEIAQVLTRHYLISALTAMLLGTDYLLINVGTLGRPDMMCAGLGSLSLALFLIFRKQGFTRAFFVANVALACCLFTHPNVIIYALLLVFLAWRYDRKSISLKGVSVAIIPYLLGVLAWGFYIAKDIASFRAQMETNANQGRFAFLFHPWRAIHSELVDRYLVAYGLGAHSEGHHGLIILKVIVLVAYLAAIITCLWYRPIRKTTGITTLLSMAGLTFFVQCFFNQKLTWYLVHIIPIYTTLVAASLILMSEQRRYLRYISMAIVCLLVAVQVGGSLYTFKTNTYRSQYVPLIAFLNKLPTNQSIYGTAAIQFGLNCRRCLRDDVALGYYDRKTPRFIVSDEIFKDAFDGLKKNDPAAYKAAHSVLLNSHEIYHTPSFQVYAVQR